MTAPFGGRRAVPPAVGSGGRDLAGGSSPRHDAGVAAPTVRLGHPVDIHFFPIQTHILSFNDFAMVRLGRKGLLLAG